MQKRSLGTNIVSLIFLTLILKGLGFINRVLIAYFYGTTELTDIYYNASGFIESVTATMTASLTVAITNIYLENKRQRKNDSFISSLVIVLSFVTLGLLILVSAFSLQISNVLAPGYSSGESRLFANTLLILSFTFPLQGVIAVFSSVLQAEKKFIPVKLTGSVSSVLTIICVLIMAGRYGINALIISYILAAVFNSCFLVYCSRKDVRFKCKLDISSIQWKRFLQMMAPLLVATAAHEINLIVDRSIASNIAVGAVSALSYSCVLFLFIENVVINSLVIAVFPELKEEAIDNNKEMIAKHTNNVIFFGELLLIPISLWSALNAFRLTQVIYLRGSFDEYSLELTGLALIGYIVGLPFLSIKNICMQVFFSDGDTATPVKYNIIAIVLNVALDFIMAHFFGIVGISLATSVSSFFAGLMLLIGCKKKNMGILDKNMKREMVLLVASNMIVAMEYYFAHVFLHSIISQFVIFVIGILSEIVLLVSLKSKYIQNIIDVIKYRNQH